MGEIMKARALLFALIFAFGQSVWACSVECPKGYLGVCVERNGSCSCACVKDAGKALEKLVELLRDAGASPEIIREGKARFKELVKSGKQDFVFELTGREGRFTVELKSREGSAKHQR
jgi:hypothetical protein